MQRHCKPASTSCVAWRPRWSSPPRTIRYARKLKEAGVPVTATRYNGTIHDFVLLNALRDLPGTQAALPRCIEAMTNIGETS
jgi:acetyl esterase/lipase